MAPTDSKRKGILLESGTNEVEFLRFFVGEAFFGMNVAKIRQAIEFDKSKLSELHGSTNGLAGNYLHRGACIPIIDLRSYLGVKPGETPKHPLLLICEFNNFIVGFQIDRIRDIMRCSWEHFTPTHTEGAESDGAALTGNVIYRDEITPILDIEAVLAELIPAAGIGRDLEKLNLVPKPEHASKRILYCEDSPTVQKVLLRSLAELGFTNVKFFTTGAEGLEYLKNGQNEVHLIISDIEMPKMDGLSLCAAVRELSSYREVPFIFFSSTVTQEMRDKCAKVGGSAAFSKPEVGKLGEHISNLFGS